MTDVRVCDICSTRAAKLVLLRRRADGLDRRFVCAECAEERAQVDAEAGVNPARILLSMERTSAGGRAAYSCRLCGTTLADIVVDGQPGCCGCYSRFAEEIERAVSQAQGRTRHVGKSPSGL